MVTLTETLKAMTTSFYIYRVTTHRVVSMTWTPEQVARVFKEYKHPPTDIICELPKSMGIDIFNCVHVPAMVFIEGNKRWSERNG